MKPLWGSQPKKYKIRAATGGPDHIDHLSTSALVWTKNSTRTVRIMFHPDLVWAIGQHLQYGVSTVTPAYIFVMKAAKSQWEVWAGYFHDQGRRSPTVLLWRSDTKPSWVKGAKSANTSKEKETKPDRRGATKDRRATPRRTSDQCYHCLTKCAGGLGRRPGECSGLYGEVSADIQRQRGLMSRDGDHFAVPGEN